MRILLLLIVFIFSSCEDDIVVKPSAMLRLEYSEAKYVPLESDCFFKFMRNENAIIQKKQNCRMNLYYPKMKATLYLTYMKIKGEHQIDSLLYDAQKLTYDHTIKAESIIEQPRIDTLNKVYGMFYMINGNAATQSQFYVTDSVNHFVTGALYFDVKPNFDSLYPAIIYLRNDIRKIMETIKWK